MAKKVLISDPISQRCISKLSSYGFDIAYRPDIDRQELLNSVQDYDILIVRGRTKVDKDIITAGKMLKIIGRAGVGLDNIDLKAAEDYGVKVLNTPQAPTNAVAELVFGLMISLAREITVADSSLKEGRWLKSQLMGLELKDKVLGVVGMGRIGSRVARIARGFGMKIVAYDVVSIREELIRELKLEIVEFDELLERSDFVTLHVPATAETFHMMNEENLRKMKKTAFLINASRGSIVDEKALFKALVEKRIAGAGLDVFETEPPTYIELLRLPNVVCTPHIGAQTEEAQEAAADIIADLIIKTMS